MSTKMKSEINVQYRKSKKMSTQNQFTYQLKDFLYNMTKDELNEIRKILKIKGISKLKKDDLIDYLEKFILNDLEGIIKKQLNEKEVLFLSKLIENQGALDYHEEFSCYIEKFEKLGLAFLSTVEDGQKVIVMPYNIRECIGKISFLSKVKNTNDYKNQWIEIIKVLLYYYGVIYAEDAHRITEKLYGKSIGFYDYLESVIKIKNEIYNYDKQNKIVYLKEVINPLYIYKEQNSRIIDYFPVTKDMVEQFENQELTDIEREFLDILINTYGVLPKEAENILKLYINRIKNGYTLEQSMKNIFTLIKFKENKDMKEFLGNLVYVYNNTNMWALKGYTPEKLAKACEKKKSSIVNRNKIGRNEPCPCGSGKKYKNCCGK
ncbi:SEC-C metal-binding domain-containing protein [Haloimpatiens sp. FM7315]|uniref:Rho termination factor N-terminal domain-containing protein n=1 Tax=Haloimpatiens sp. FM7315 TaxID=3298609 RepID=UPI003977E36B